MKRARWALFLSGRGSTAQAVMDNMANINVQMIISSKKSALGLMRARRFGIPVLHFHKNMSWDDLHQTLKTEKIEHLFLLGFMKLLPAEFVHKWQGKIANVHPSLLPAYPGLEAMEKSFQDQADMGVTVHVVTPEMDAGPVLLQKRKFRSSLRRLNTLDFENAQTRMAFCEQELVRRVSELERLSS